MQFKRSISPLPYSFGVTIMPEWFQYEGIDAVLDRVQACGADAIVTSPYLLERAPEGEGGREPPPDGEAGKVRPLERELFGAKELWVRAGPAFEHDFSLYRGLRYQPAQPGKLTRANPDLLDRVVAQSQRRGLAIFMQIMAASPPAYRVQFSGAQEDDQCLGPDGVRHDYRVDKNASLASPHVTEYIQVLLKELATRYPDVNGFRLDWPEYPPYDLASAMFDFNPSALKIMRGAGYDPDEIRSAAQTWVLSARTIAQRNARDGAKAIADGLAPLFRELLHPETALRGLVASKVATCFDFLVSCRAALDEVSGPHRRLEPQIMPPPLQHLSGFPLNRLDGLADAVGVKLYTMHWPMIARYWARDLVGSVNGPAADAASVAIGQLFGFLNAPPEDPQAYRYPLPVQAHPVSLQAQQEKIRCAKTIAGNVPVVAFAHAYGPIPDVLERFEAARGSADAVWLNRYGYLSDEKLAALDPSMMRKIGGG